MDVYPKKTNWKTVGSPTFPEAWFIAANIQKQPSCPSMAESINTRLYRHTREVYSAIRKKRKNHAATATHQELAMITRSD